MRHCTLVSEFLQSITAALSAFGSEAGAPVSSLVLADVRARSRAPHSPAIAASLATVFMLRAVPSRAAGMWSFERPIPSG